jgi:leucyl aminopeptidase
MLSIFARRGEIGSATPIPVHAVLSKGLERFLGEREGAEARWLKAIGFGAKDGELVIVPNSEGGIGSVVLGLGQGRDSHALALLSERLPAGLYTLGQIPDGFAGMRAAYGWAIGSYASTVIAAARSLHALTVRDWSCRTT